MSDSLSHFSGLEQRVLEQWRQRGWPPGARIVCGFSGGVDSLALASVLAHLAARDVVRPILVHVDHRLRPESASEQHQAAELARALGLPFRGLTVTGNLRQLHPGVGEEEAARRERRRLLADVVHQERAVALALAHQQNDQAETVLLHLMRGAGLTGSAGMGIWSEQPACWWAATGAAATGSAFIADPPPQSERTSGGDPLAPFPGLTADGAGDEAAGAGTPMTSEPGNATIGVWRPLLGESRQTLEAFVQSLALAPLHDPSNDDRKYRRNAVRHDVLPLLESISPGAVAALTRHAELAADDERVLESLAQSLVDRALTDQGALKRAVLFETPVAIQRRAVREWLRRRVPITGRIMSADRTDAVRRLLVTRGRGRRVEIGEGVSVLDHGATLDIERAGAGELG